MQFFCKLVAAVDTESLQLLQSLSVSSVASSKLSSETRSVKEEKKDMICVLYNFFRTLHKESGSTTCIQLNQASFLFQTHNALN